MTGLFTDTIAESTSGSGITFSNDIVPATPLSHRNIIINGAMQVAQRGTSATVSDGSNEGYSTLDRWYLNFNSSLGGSVTFSQNSETPNGFSNSLKIQCASTATPSGSSTQNLGLQYRIEAQDLQQLGYGSSNAKIATLSFYAKRAGTDWGKLSVVFRKPDNTVEYSLPTATTLTTSWARYTIPVPANTATAIDDDNGEGLRIEFVLAGSSTGTYASTADTSWGSTRKDYASDVGNLLSDTSNIFYLTGVQLELGSVATPFEYRSIGDELDRCQRYYQKSYNLTVAPGTSSTVGAFSSRFNASVGNRMDASVRFNKSMKSTPSVKFYTLPGTIDNVSYMSSGTTHSSNRSVTAVYHRGHSGFGGITVSPAADQGIAFHYTADAEIT